MTQSSSASDSRVKLDVDPDALVRMGPAVKGSKGVLSPFRNDVDSLAADVREKLTVSGVMDSRGVIRSENAMAIELLASAPRATRVQLIGAGGVFEQVSYFPDNGDAAVSLKTVQGALRIEEPAATGEAMAYLANMVGASVIVGTEFDASMPIHDAIVFAALVDESRRSLLMAMVGDGKKKERALTAEAIDVSLREGSGGLVSLVSIVRSVLGIPVEMTPREIADAIERLVSAGHARRKGKGIVLADAGAELANNFVTIGSVLRLTAGRESAGNVDHVAFTCAIGGLHDILSVENASEQVHFETLTSRRLLEIVAFYLAVGDAVPRREPKYCRNCGRKQGDGDRFCAGCGTRLENRG